jgi:hypothetical protein
MMRGEVPDTPGELRAVEVREFGALGAALRKLRDERERVAGLVALCEELLEGVVYVDRFVSVDELIDYRARLAKLKGGE